MRKKATLAKKQLLRTRILHLVNLIDKNKKTYRVLRNSYISEIKKCKRQTWQNFVLAERSKDPWDIVYKIVRDKFQKSSFWTALKLPNGERTISVGTTVKALFDKCVPAAETEAQSEEDSTTKRKIRNYRNQNLENIISCDEIDAAINSFKNNKAQD